MATMRASQHRLKGDIKRRFTLIVWNKGAEFYETQNRNLQINYLKSKALKLGLQIIEAPAA
jgi:hypothetical protein